MHKIEKIDTVANLTKLAVNFLPIDDFEKEKRKLDIDALALLLKQCVMSPTPEVQRIRMAARLYNLDRVVVFPCTVKGRDEMLIRMYGGDTSAFCVHLNIPLLPVNRMCVNPILIDLMEHQHGVVLYDRNMIYW